jgi:hypothetical protein
MILFTEPHPKWDQTMELNKMLASLGITDDNSPSGNKEIKGQEKRRATRS